MGGKRTDKEDAWKSLEAMLTEQGLFDEPEQVLMAGVLAPTWAVQVRHALQMLKGMGRLDSAQIKGIKQFLRIVILAIRFPDKPREAQPSQVKGCHPRSGPAWCRRSPAGSPTRARASCPRSTRARASCPRSTRARALVSIPDMEVSP